MNSHFVKNIGQLKDLNNKLAMELVYAQVGSDNGLLPINYILSQLEEVCHAEPPSPILQGALEYARKWINDIFDTTGLFNAEVIKQLSSWTEWWENACEAISNEQQPPPTPEQWNMEIKEHGTSSANTAPVSQSVENLDAEEVLNLNLSAEDDVELLREFISESNEHLQNIELGVLVLEDNPDDADTLNSIFRAFHTFKGGSALLHLTPVNHLAHELESLLDLARQHKLVINRDVINLILEGGDLLKKFTCEIQGQISGSKPGTTILIPTSGLINRVKDLINLTQKGEKNPNMVQNAPVSGHEKALETQHVAENDPSVASPEAKLARAASPTIDSMVGSSGQAGIVKVATQKLDNLVDLVGEMVIAESQITQDPALQSVTSTRLLRNLAQLARITNDLQKTAMSLRMVPIRSTFQKMNRLVRDIASKQGKEVELRLLGEDTELDRTIVEQLNDPLVHMVRNSIDHGLEKPDVRIAHGKQAKGIVQLNAWHQGGNIVIEVMDDGAGLNKERILNKGIEKGLVKPNAPMDEQEIFHLIFAPGFSTAEKVTDISGRGVGMDVVRRNIEQLRGKIEIHSTPGQGSRFTIFLPLTLAIIDGLMVSVGEQRFILPSLLVRESFRPTAKMISSLYGRGELINVRGKLVPLLRLHDYFSIEPKSSDPTQSVVIVVGSEHEQRCLLVDNLLGKQEVVIKSLGEMFKKNKALAGAAILGDGRVGLILDIDYLVKMKSTTLEQAA